MASCQAALAICFHFSNFLLFLVLLFYDEEEMNEQIRAVFVEQLRLLENELAWCSTIGDKDLESLQERINVLKWLCR